MMKKYGKQSAALALSGMLVLSGLGMSLNSTSFATTDAAVKDTVQNQTNTATTRDHMKGHFQQRNNPMDALIKDGTLTQVQADAFGTAMKAAHDSKTSPEDVLKNLVTAGTLTQAQADAITKGMPAKPAGQEGSFKNHVNPMDALIKDGTLTQVQADAFGTAMKAAHDSKTSPEDVLKNLVTAGTLTQAQADAISKGMPAKPAGQEGSFNHVNPMDALIKDGTLTQVQADAFGTAMKAAHDSKTSPEDVLKNLVTAGTLTQAQADAITKSIPARPAHK